MIPALEVHDASSGEDRIVGTARFVGSKTHEGSCAQRVGRVRRS